MNGTRRGGSRNVGEGVLPTLTDAGEISILKGLVNSLSTSDEGGTSMGEVWLVDARRAISSAEEEQGSSVGRQSLTRRVENWTWQMMEELVVTFVDAVGDWETMEDVCDTLGGEDWFIALL